MKSCKIYVLFVSMALLLYSCTEQPIRKLPRMEFFMFEHILYDFPEEGTAEWKAQHLGDIVTYVRVDSGLVIFKSRENLKNNEDEDTTFFFSNEFIKEGKFQMDDSISYIDTMHWVEEDMQHMYLLKTGNGINSVSKYKKLPGYILHLVDMIGKSQYNKDMNESKAAVVRRMAHINATVFRFTLFPNLVFSPPVVKMDEEVEE